MPLVIVLLLMAETPIPVAAAAVGDRVQLRASHQADVRLHQTLRGIPGFLLVPDATVTTVTDLARDG
jgi:hypothetical protein